MRPARMSLDELAEHIATICVETPSGCRLWPNTTDRKGYGLVKHRGKQRRAHRVVLAATLGLDLEGPWIGRHTCDTPACCERSHLEPGTPQDNVDDRERRGRTRKGSLHGRSKLTEAQVSSIRNAEGLHREIAALYGVSRSLVSNIKRGIVRKVQQ